MCLECDKFFEDARYLRNHLRAVHDSVDKSKFVCLFVHDSVDKSKFVCLFVHDSVDKSKFVCLFVCLFVCS